MSAGLVYLGLGANLGDPRAQIDRAIRALEERGPAISVLERARLYRSAPIGPPGQPDYLNTAVELRTTLSPLELLDLLKSIERELGRTDGVRWGPRVIDLDILVFGALCLDHPRLVIPHRELKNRRFALLPLAELAPELVIPGLGQSVSALLAALADDPKSVSLLSA